MKESQVLELIAKQLAQEISAEEARQLREWVSADVTNQAFFAEIQELWDISGELPEPQPAVDAQKAWDKMAERLEEPPGGKIVPFRWRRSWLAIAASVLLLIGAFALIPLWTPDSGEVPLILATNASEKRELTLPDQSLVRLSEKSTLTYVDKAGERQLTLIGEAYFEVVANAQKPFRVLTESTETLVLGTEFSVRAYPEEPTVAVRVREGRVAVAPVEKTGGGAGEQVLSPGQVALYSKKDQTFQKLRAFNDLDKWSDQWLNFRDVPLGRVVDQLNAFYQTKIRLANEGLAACSVNIDFQNTGLDEALEDLSFIMDLKVTMEAGTYLLDGAPCTN